MTPPAQSISQGWRQRAWDALDELRSVNDAAEAMENALEAIAFFDASQGGPIAPRETPTSEAMRRIAHDALPAGAKDDLPR